MSKIRPKERDSIIQSLRAGVTPRLGQYHIQVGRANEVEALLGDIERIADGGSSVRFIIGDYGAGKTFFLNLIRSIAMEKKLVTLSADFNPQRRIHGTGGQARSLYTELMRNIATRSKPEGGALPSIIERFVSEAVKEGRTRGISPGIVIAERMDVLSEMVGGYEFAEVIGSYWKGHDIGDDKLKSNALRWLRGEFATRTDARAALGVRTIIDDATVYDHLKLMALLTKMAGYQGIVLLLDELVNLYKLTNTKARNSNYEEILRIVNDCLQGSASGIGFLFGGTPDFLMDTRRGLYSYKALQSRLAENTFAREGLKDFGGPVLRLANLSPEDMYILLTKIRHVYAFGIEDEYLVSEEGLKHFMEHCHKRIGEAYFKTPRNTVKSFVDMLAILDQNPDTEWKQLVGQVAINKERNTDIQPMPEDAEDDDDLVSFKL